MASSILTGDRRYGTVRGKLTVLGKVPKPINLPSQKSENHGLDPNVEIVPRGTLSWGSKAATPNAWVSSASSSPHADESANSPLSGRPSSSGSGPRPSTSGSDKSHELTSKAWGQNSRPSSASGIFASNQLSLAPNRPRSAESRPVSSQLSRFAENSTENSVAWGSATKSSGFIPSSVDFPPLGSENNSESHMQRGHSSHGRPASASGSSTQKERPDHLYADVKTETDSRNVDMQATDSYPYVQGDIPLNMEKWLRDPQQGRAYPSANMPPPQFGNWHGPAVNASDGFWCRGTPGGPFRPAGSAGAYPIERFAYFRPQFPGLLPNPQSIPRPGGGHGCYNPKHGDMHLSCPPPDSCMTPSQQITTLTPGVLQTALPSDGYHDSQANYFNSIDSGVPSIGSPPDAHYQYDRKSNVHSRKSHMCYSSCAPSMDKEQAKSDQADEIHNGQHVVLLKQHIVHEKREQSTLSKFPHFEGSNQCETSCQLDLRANSKSGETSSITPTPGTGRSSESLTDWEGHSSDNANLTKSLEGLNKVTDDSLMKEHLSGAVLIHEEQQFPAIKKDTSLMEKIEILNNKTRIAERHVEGGQLSSKDMVKTLQHVNLQAKLPEKNTCTFDAFDGNCIASGMAQPASHREGTSIEETEEGRKVVLQPTESQAFKSTKPGCLEDGRNAHHQIRRKGHFMQSGLDCHVKPGFTGSQGDGELVKRTSGRNSTEISSPGDKDNCIVSDVPLLPMSQDITEKQVVHNATNAGDRSLATKLLDSISHHEIQGPTQKMIAIQDSKQLDDQQEKEQNTKYLTKLDRLDGHSAHGFHQNFDNSTPTSEDFHHMLDFKSESTHKTDGTVDEAPSANSAGNDSGSTTDPSLRLHNQSLSLDQDANKRRDATRKSSMHFHESKFPKHKHVGYRRKQSTIQEKIQGGHQFSVGTVGRPNSSGDVSMHHLASDSVPKIEDLPTQPKKRNNRTSKSKFKADEASSRFSMQSSAHNEENLGKGPVSVSKTQSESMVEINPDPAQSVIGTLKNHCSRDEVGATSTVELPQETEHHLRVSNQRKPQSSRSTRNQQGIKSGDKVHGCEAVTWAPVRPQNKTIQSEGTTLNHNNQSDNSLENDGHDTQNGMKTKRAEMERYVPKPAVKERLYQNSQQNLPCSNQALSDEAMVVPDFDGISSVKGEFDSDATNGESNKSSRCGKMHASWRQQDSAGLLPVSQSFSHEGSISNDATGYLQPHRHHQSKGDSRAEVQLVYDNLRDKKLHNNSGSAPSLTDIVGLQCGTNSEKEGLQALEFKKSATLGNENARFSHAQKRWQPKSHAYPHSIGRGKRDIGSQRVASQGPRFDKEFHSQGTGNFCENEDVNNSARITGGVETRNAENHEANAVPLSAIKKDPAEKQTQLPNKLSEGELPGLDNQQEQPVSSAKHRHGTSNGHYRRGHEATYRVQYGWQDAAVQNPHFSRGRRNDGSQFEYQQIGSSEKPSDFSQQNSVDLDKQEGPRVHGTRNKGRGPNYYRRRGGGHFYVQTSRIAVHVDEQKNSRE